MSRNFLLADFIAHLRNSFSAKLRGASFIHSTLIENVCVVLKNDGYIFDYEAFYDSSGKKNINVTFVYHKGVSAIQSLELVSRPSRRIFIKLRDFKPYKNGMGLVVVSTSKGVVSYKDAIANKVGGEVLCRVF